MLGMLKAKGELSKKPKYSRFTQQELPACRLLLTPAVVIQSLFVIGAVFVPLGAVCLLASNQVVEVVTRYDDQCLVNVPEDQRSNVTQQGNMTACQVSLTVPANMDPPIYVYYQLTNFYQNYRRYVKSQSEAQLSGQNVTDLSACAPEDYLNGSQAMPIRPCGLIAWSLFNDTFAISTTPVGAAPLAVSSDDISWPSDRNVKFGNVPPENFNTVPPLRGGATINTTLSNAQNLQVWMRTAALPTFRKLYGQLSTPLPANSTLYVNVTNQYNSYAYGGTKSLVLSTTSWLGGKNSFLGIAYLTVGGICIALSIVFFILQFTNYRPLGDTSYLSWNRKAAELREPLAPVPPEGASTAPGDSTSATTSQS